MVRMPTVPVRYETDEPQDGDEGETVSHAGKTP
jgi:hypothetical protein